VPTTSQPPDVRPVAVTVLCFLAVALVSPLSLILGLVCWGVLANTFGSYFADNSGAVFYLLLAIVQTSLFGLLWLPVSSLSRGKSVAVRCGLVVALTLVYLAFWAGWTAWVYAEMARTGNWL
jgi:hypothetical protein